MSAQPFYVQQLKNLHAKYGLNQNARGVLKALDDYKFGRIGADELGRTVRLSPNMRRAITDTISKCAGIMAKQPGEMKNCLDLINGCTEVLAVAGEPSLSYF